MTSEQGATFVLEFSYPAQGHTHLPIAEVADTYLHVLGLTTIKPDIVKGMLPLWLHGHQKGDPRIQEAALGPLRSPEISFFWPWFIEWLEHFREARLLPRAWEPFADRVMDRRLGLRDERIPLLADVLSRTVWNRGEASKHAARNDPSLPGWKRTYSYELVPDCEASESLLPDRRTHFVAGDWRTYPPYFPGDRTSVQRKVLKE